jgi:hypothetical protein
MIGCRSNSSDEKKTSDSTTTDVTDSTSLLTDSAQNEWIGLGDPQFGDLDSMVARRRIRVIVPHTHAIYYLEGKERRGIAFEAMNVFGKELTKHLKFNRWT